MKISRAAPLSASTHSHSHSPLPVSSLDHREGLAVRIDPVSKCTAASKANERRPLKRLTASFVRTERGTIRLLSFNLTKDNQTLIAGSITVGADGAFMV